MACGQVLSGFPSFPDVRFFCRVVDKKSNFEIDLLSIEAQKAWTGTVSTDTEGLYADVETQFPLETLKSFLELGLSTLEPGHHSEDLTLDMIEQTDALVVLELCLRLGAGDCYWRPALRFRLEQTDAARREKLEVQASIASLESQLKEIPVQTMEQTQKSPGRKRFSLWGSLLAVAIAVVVLGASLCGLAPSTPRTAFARMKPFLLRGQERVHNGAICWESSSHFGANIFAAECPYVSIAESGLVYVSIALRHSHCRSKLAFKVFQGTTQIASIRDYVCEGSTKTSTTYTHTFPVKANDKLWVLYSGGGQLHIQGSFLDILMLPQAM